MVYIYQARPKKCLKKDNSKNPHPSRHHPPPPPFLPKENKGPHMKIRPPAYGPHKEKKGPPHGEKGPHNVKIEKPTWKKNSRKRRTPTIAPPPRAPMYGIAAVL